MYRSSCFVAVIVNVAMLLASAGGLRAQERTQASPGVSVGAPFELDVIHLAIEGFASSLVEWDKTSTRPECPTSMAQQK
jgi:hypothetical protein